MPVYSLADRVKVAVTGFSSGNLALGAAPDGFRTFATAFSSGGSVTVPYVLEDGTAWETGTATYVPASSTLQNLTPTTSSTSPAMTKASGGYTPSASAVVYLSPNALTVQNPTLSTLTVAGDTYLNGSVYGSGVVTPGGGDYLNGSNKLLIASAVWNSAQMLSLAFGSTVTPDFSAGINFTMTATGNFTLANPSNIKVGQSGRIRILQDATGSRTISYGSAWRKASADSSALSTAPNAMDVLYYDVLDSLYIVYSIKRMIG